MKWGWCATCLGKEEPGSKGGESEKEISGGKEMAESLQDIDSFIASKLDETMSPSSPPIAKPPATKKIESARKKIPWETNYERYAEHVNMNGQDAPVDRKAEPVLYRW